MHSSEFIIFYDAENYIVTFRGGRYDQNVYQDNNIYYNIVFFYLKNVFMILKSLIL